MDLILVGYGKMNRLVEEIARERGHRIAMTVRRPSDWVSGWQPGLVAVDFSVPGAVIDNLQRAIDAGIPVVIGTTGWYGQLDRAREIAKRVSVGVVYGANFSVGVNAFYRLIEAAARVVPPSYDCFITEAHHNQKKDAPSGTAGELALRIEASGRKRPAISSVRAGFIPGTHTVGFDSEADTVTLTHTARSRRGFAEGALMAASWIAGRSGLYEFSENFDAIVASMAGSR